MANDSAIESKVSCPACVRDKNMPILEGEGKLALIWRYEDSGTKGPSS